MQAQEWPKPGSCMHNIDIPTDNESDMDWGGGKEIMGPSVTHPLVEDDTGLGPWPRSRSPGAGSRNLGPEPATGRTMVEHCFAADDATRSSPE